MPGESDEQPLVRAFIGIGIPDALRSNLVDAQAELKKSGAHVGWTRPENIHVTLVFLGNIGSDTVESLPDALDHACSPIGRSECPVNGIGFFGGRRPRILWAGVEDHAGVLALLHRRISDAVTMLGIELESRPYTPHITLGRSRSSRGATELATAVDRLTDRPFGELTVEGVTLYKSQLSPGGAVYSVLHEAELSTG